MFGFFRKSNRVKKLGEGRGTVRAFAAAEAIPRTLAPWVFDGGFSNTEIASSLSIVRARSRDMAKNSEQYVRWLDLFVANVVGPKGFDLKALPCIVKGKPDVDAEAAKFLEYHFWKWATTPAFVDTTGRKTFARICRLVAENWARDGEALVIMYKTDANPYGFTLRVVRPDALDETINNTRAGGGNIIRNGVEVDAKTLRPVAYYFRADREDPGVGYIGTKPVVRVPAEKVLHVFTQHDEAQTRGIPLGHAVLKKLKMLDLYNEAELIAANDEAHTIGVFYTDKGEEGEVAKLNDDVETSNKLCQKAKGGGQFVLPNTWKYDSHTPQHPNREVAAFKNSMLRDVASGLGIEYACFANDWNGVNFSSVRAGTLAERDHWKTLQEDFVEMFVTPVFKAWLATFLNTRTANPYVPSEFDRLVEHEFRPRTWAWVDPMKDVKAAVEAVANGWKTPTQIAAEYGTDFEENLAEMTRLLPLIKKAGLTITRKVEETKDTEGGDKDDKDQDDK